MHKFLLFGMLGLLGVNSQAQAQLPSPFPSPYTPPASTTAQEVQPIRELAPLIPVLIEALSDSDATVRGNAEDALAGLGQLALPKVKELLDGSNKKLRVAGARVLGKMANKGHRYVDMLPPLVKGLKDEDVELRREASSALAQMVAGRIAPSAEKVMRLAKVVNPQDVYDTIHRNKGKDTLDWPSAEIQKLAGADAWGDWRPVKGDVGEVIAVCTHPFEPTTRIYILKIGKNYAPMGEKGIELLP
jgi:hypothetical protein